jgi:hypothetical protein
MLQVGHLEYNAANVPTDKRFGSFVIAETGIPTASPGSPALQCAFTRLVIFNKNRIAPLTNHDLYFFEASCGCGVAAVRDDHADGRVGFDDNADDSDDAEDDNDGDDDQAIGLMTVASWQAINQLSKGSTSTTEGSFGLYKNDLTPNGVRLSTLCALPLNC